MRRFSILCLATLAVIACQNTAEAGHRGRRAAKTAVVASTAAVAVAVTPRTETVVAVAYTPTPDLTIEGISADHDALAITIKNIGKAPSPQTRLQVELRRPADGGLVAVETNRVLPLEVNQSVRVRIRSAPIMSGQVVAYVDPDQQVVESNEQNNSLTVSLASPPQAVAPPVIEDEAVWRQPNG